ncbi:hypothetical protein DMT42_02140 [Streptomyces actuosus]|uniref:Uncharacterized protein n=1 Tax=Streptomyces actuosus TaxID=1885 RepID=A0A2U9NVB3_STRAS|nr:hypothetical protein DMT42_02140 [Streptomyces actuosus]
MPGRLAGLVFGVGEGLGGGVGASLRLPSVAFGVPQVLPRLVQLLLCRPVGLLGLPQLLLCRRQLALCVVPLSLGLALAVVRPPQCRIGVVVVGAPVVQPSLGLFGRCAGLFEAFLPLAAALGQFVLGAGAGGGRGGRR